MLDQPQQLLEQIVEACSGKQIWLGYSGGIDSHVLLHLLATAQHSQLAKIQVIHVNHGLHPDSALWSQHCAEVAADLGVRFCTVNAEVSDIASLGMEAAARKARYHAIAEQLTDNDVLLTAQHQQDQAETLLLQLLRGAGPKGLSAMASTSQFNTIHIVRPLLTTSQAAIKAYAQRHQLKWIEDPSNSDTRWNRNYIRHTIWPSLEQRWPSAAKTLSRSAQNCAEADQLMAELAQMDLETLEFDSDRQSLSLQGLLTLSEPRCRNVLRYVLTVLALPLPSATVLQHMLDEVCLARVDSMPVLQWAGAELRRYQDRLYFMLPLAEHDSQYVMACQGTSDLVLNDGRVLTWQQSKETGLSKQILAKGVSLRFRQGGEKIQLLGHHQHKSLKHLFQEWTIPPWQRDRIPLLFSGEELIAVVGYALSELATASQGQQAYLPVLKSG